MSRISDLAGFSTALSTTQDLSVGVITATTFFGDGSGLTGVASTDNIITATPVNVLNNVRITGFTTAGAVSASALNVSGLSTFSGDVSIAGTLTYLDVTNVDSIGVITGRNGLDITGVGTFSSDIKLGPNAQLQTGGTDNLAITAPGSGHVTLNNYSIFYPAGNVILNNGGQGTTQIKNQVYVLSGITSFMNDVSVENDTELGRNLNVTGVCTASSFSGDGSALTGIEAGITTTEKTASANSTVFLGLSTAQHHTINLAAGITTIDCTGGSVGESHSVVIINPSSVGTGVTVGFATDFLFPSGSVPSLPTGADDISLISFVVKQTGAGGTEVLASAGLNYSN